jgi:acetyl esterase/lipase
VFRCCLTSALLALALFLVVPAPAAPQGATPAAEQPPTPPGQPATGPGGAEYVFPDIRVTSLGDDPGGGRLFEPAAEAGSGTPPAEGPLPLVLLIDGCCYRAEDGGVNGGGVDGGEGFRAWIEHLVRRGAIVVYPIYRQESKQADVAAAMRAALAELVGGEHARPDLMRTAVIGFSFGGPVAADYAADAATAGLPAPGALLIYGPRSDTTGPDRAPPPPAIRAVVMIGEHDPGALRRGAESIWAWLAALPADQRDFVSLRDDDHGERALTADHWVPLANARPSDPAAVLDALDWYGTWKLADALMACAFAGEWCEYALGDTPEQRFMGTWSDGVPVQEPVITDDPTA